MVTAQSSAAGVLEASVRAIAVLDLERPSEPLRRWRPTDDVKPAIPAGRPSLDLFWRRLTREEFVPIESLAEQVASAFLGVRIECAQ